MKIKYPYGLIILIALACTLTAIMVMGLNGCATWSDTANSAIGTAHHAGIVIGDTTSPVIDEQCSAAIAVCLRDDRGESNCPEFDKCKKLREDFADALKKYQESLKSLLAILNTFEKLGARDGSE